MPESKELQRIKEIQAELDSTGLISWEMFGELMNQPPSLNDLNPKEVDEVKKELRDVIGKLIERGFEDLAKGIRERLKNI